MSKRLEGKVAIVTGASGEQGAATAVLFVAEGANVVLTDLNEPSSTLIDSMGSRALFLRHDVSSSSDWREVVTRTREQFGKLDVLINNARRLSSRRFGGYRRCAMGFLLSRPSARVFLGMRAAVQTMQEAEGGSIVNVSSNAGIGRDRAFSRKWAVRGMSKLAASELAAPGIWVNVIFPGIVDTPMLGENTPERLEAYKNMIPMRRIGTPEEIGASFGASFAFFGVR